MTEEEKHQQLIALMSFLEATNDSIKETHELQHLQFSDITPEIWVAIQENQNLVREMLEMFKQSLVHGSKIIDNDACHAHLITVIEAP